MRVSEACYHSELFICKQQGKRWTFFTLRILGHPGSPCTYGSCLWENQTLGQRQLGWFYSLEGIKVILIPRVVLAVQRLPGCQFTAGLERLQL